MKLTDWVYESGDDFLENNEKKYMFSFIGSACQLDERSKAAEKYCQSRSKAYFSVSYVSSALQILDENGVCVTESDQRFDQGEIIVDATTVDVPELLKIIEWLNKKKRSFDVCYFEPEKYVNQSDNCESSYVISDDGGGINFIPPFLCPTSIKSVMVVSLGFEGHRFGSIIESEEFSVGQYYALAGVPAFKLGMEKVSFLMNRKSLEDSQASIEISGANDPVETYKRLEAIRLINCEDKKVPKKIILAPFGTKPVALAMCIFAVNNRKQVGVVYDFVQRKCGRSSGIGMAHKWSFQH